MTLTLLGLIISGFLSVNQTWQRIELWAFDRWTLWSAPGQSSLPITIVGIDEASFASLNQRWPWPRDWHAKVMQSLLDDGAAVVAFDVLFAEMANEAEDASFERAIAQAPKSIVLSADHAYRETDLLRQRTKCNWDGAKRTSSLLAVKTTKKNSVTSLLSPMVTSTSYAGRRFTIMNTRSSSDELWSLPNLKQSVAQWKVQTLSTGS